MLQSNEFCINKAMQVVMRHQRAHELTPSSHHPFDVDSFVINEDVLKQCTLKMVHIVQQDDTYLPIFKRLKTELEKLRQNNELKEYARKITDHEVEL